VKYLSVCSGIEAATVAWHHLGWEPAGFAEVEKFPAQVLAHHYPGVPNFGDLTKHDQWPLASGAVDLLVGGTPCQAFSVAGLRRGMDDARGQLTLEFVRLAARLCPRWIVWENVPGVLSSGGGRDFGSFLGALGELGYGWAYRVLDAQYFGVAQRRRRVFVVGYLGDWRRAAAVLFERESLRGNPPPRREAGQRPAGASVAGAASGRQHAAKCPAEIACTLNTRYGDKQGLEDQHAFGGASLFVPAVGTDCYNGSVTGDVAATIGTPGSSVNASGPTVMVRQPAMAFHENQRGKVALSDTAGSLTGGGGKPGQGYSAVMQPIAFKPRQSAAARSLGAQVNIACTLEGGGGGNNKQAIAQPLAPTITASNDPSRSPQSSEVTQQVAAVHSALMQVRRLTPVECERLQGFPDGYTDIRPRGKDTPDGPRYKALGNSMAVPVMRWIGERIAKVDQA
jgi:DNA (cytosine-5)-methyltransferase 1